MRKKIFLILTSLVLVFSCLFIPIAANADSGKTYNYTDSEVYTDTSNLGNYAIQDIETLTINGALVFKSVFTLSSSSFIFTFLHHNTGTWFHEGNYFYYNVPFSSDKQIDCNFAIRCLTSTTGINYQATTNSFGFVGNTQYYKRNLTLKFNNTFEIFFSSAAFGGTYSDMKFFVEENSDRIFSKNFSSKDYDLHVFNDMNSQTNFTYDNFLLDFLFIRSNPYFSNFLFQFQYFAFGSVGMPYLSSGYTAARLSSFAPALSNFRFYKNDSYIDLGGADYFQSTSTTSVPLNTKNEISFNYNFLYKDFYFSVLRPVYRTNNTLIIYNYDYDNLLNNVNGVTYQLQKGSDKYNVIYNGSLPNSTFIYVSNKNINNILFDKYIYFYLSFDDNLVSYNFFDFQNYYSKTFNMGFDFNFTYYNEPLVTSNGSYNFDFKKPTYVDMRFSLSPFYIPILEAVQNALIFLVFYCPLISDILELIHLNQFFGAIFNIFGFSNGNISILGINLGGFIWACIAFVIFFKLLQTFMPVLWGSGKEVYNDITYNSRRYRAEVKKAEREKSYEIYKASKEKKKKN